MRENKFKVSTDGETAIFKSDIQIVLRINRG